MRYRDWRKEADELERLPLWRKVKRSKQLIRQAMKLKDPETPLVINFSGGKDSLVMATLAREVTQDVELCYVDGGFDLPMTPAYVQEKAKEFGLKLHMIKAGEVKVAHRKNGPLVNCQQFEDYVRHYGYFPTCGNRWCSIWCKQRLIKAYWKEKIGDKVMVKCNGVRMFESATRKWKYGNPKYWQKHCYKGMKHFRPDREHHPTILVYPILEWTDKDVVDYLRLKRVPMHEGYKLFGVSGCKWCPVHQPEVYYKILQLYPDLYNDFIALESEIRRPCVRGGIWLRDIREQVLKENMNMEVIANGKERAQQEAQEGETP